MNLTDAQKLLGDTMRAHGLLARGWTQKFDNGTKRFGCCDYTEKRITLSRHLVGINPEHIVANTILHEIAHALVGPGHGHGEVWSRTAREIGCSGNRCWTPGQNGAKALAPKWVGFCPNGCSVHTSRDRLTDRAKRLICVHCQRGQATNYHLVWKEFHLTPKDIRDRIMA